MTEIRVLIVDDSPMVRDILADIFGSDPEISVVGMAENGLQAIDQTRSLKPDIVAMDINMPLMDGLETIERIMSSTPVPILVITDIDHARIAFSALSKGALDVYHKSFYSQGMAAELIAKVKLLSKVKVIRHILPKGGEASVSPPLFAQRKSTLSLPHAAERRGSREAFQVVAIASSTGGPRALAQIFSGMSEGFPVPIVVAQHMSGGFVGGLVEWLDSVTPVKVKFAADGESLRENHIYFAPAGMHMMVNANGRLALVDVPPGDLFHPSCDLLLASVGEAFGAQSLGVILTGMGDDGVEGLRSIRGRGGYTVAQDEQTSVVFGMPRVAIDNGLIDKISPIGEIGGLLKQLVGRKAPEPQVTA
ncbi:MAG: chemotaxis-specific protein-glutamate methyltransferase CheB [Gallionella sp.]|nr:chemotaxis-specific protein-glutamate methyltransferase CheB [Gallionella sp.]